MGFISMLFAGGVLIIVVIGLINFLLGGLLDFIWIIRAIRKKKTHIIYKVFAIGISIAGFVMFVLPVAFVSLIGDLSERETQRHFDKTENKVYLEENQELGDGFMYKGKQLVRLEGMQSPKKEKLTEDGVIVPAQGAPIYFSKVANEGDFAIYYFDRYGYLFCYEDELDRIQKYYHDPAHMKTKVSFSVNDETKDKMVDIPGDIVRKIRNVYDNHTEEGECSGNVDEFESLCTISAFSDDKLYYELVSLDVYQNRIVLSWTVGGGAERALYLPKELEDYVRENIVPLLSE